VSSCNTLDFSLDIPEFCLSTSVGQQDGPTEYYGGEKCVSHLMEVWKKVHKWISLYCSWCFLPLWDNDKIHVIPQRRNTEETETKD